MKKQTCQDDMPMKVSTLVVMMPLLNHHPFIAKAHTFVYLCARLETSCSCGMRKGPWVLEFITQEVLVALHPLIEMLSHSIINEGACAANRLVHIITK